MHTTMNTQSVSTAPLVLIPTVNGMIRIRQMEEVKYILGSGPVSELHLQCGRILKCTRGLVHFHNLLNTNQGFYRFSQSLLVNMIYVDGVHTRKQEVTLRCGTALPISRRCCQQFKKWCRSFDSPLKIDRTEFEENKPNGIRRKM